MHAEIVTVCAFRSVRRDVAWHHILADVGGCGRALACADTERMVLLISKPV
jgi:hypothetical protein